MICNRFNTALNNDLMNDVPVIYAVLWKPSKINAINVNVLFCADPYIVSGVGLCVPRPPCQLYWIIQINVKRITIYKQVQYPLCMQHVRSQA